MQEIGHLINLGMINMLGWNIVWKKMQHFAFAVDFLVQMFNQKKDLLIVHL